MAKWKYLKRNGNQRDIKMGGKGGCVTLIKLYIYQRNSVLLLLLLLLPHHHSSVAAPPRPRSPCWSRGSIGTERSWGLCASARS